MRVLFMMLDGLRPDAISEGDTPELVRFMRRGAYTLSAQSVMPSMTLPCHMSIFHSLPPSRHGVTTNQYTPMVRPVTGLIEQLKAHGKRSACVYNWEPLRDLSRPDNLYMSYFVNTSYDRDGDILMAEQTLNAVKNPMLDFIFGYFGTIDVAGHDFGWMSAGYLQQAKHVDDLLAEILRAVPEDMTVIIQADHGGHERTHGTDKPDDMTIPWMMAGPDVRQNHVIAQAVTLLDTAPTVLHLFGIPCPPEWEGRAVTEGLA